MLLLDTDGHQMIARDRAELTHALLEHLPKSPDNDTLIVLAAACLDCLPEDVVLVET